ncbi:hypothetical protein ICN84_01125 [Akkermansia glycaniphila]|uniref:hypothetical protein n=1 Tax=Akkermansia glycaniphila TaxID=1679444 RepID=UPI001C0323F5|nr:hypothetical protein [Akkermansia glycaniphila]MBT9448674.1 hypothetical protein [Akkermansia glycaniphila]
MNIFRLLPGVPLIAFTAPATLPAQNMTPEIRQDIARLLTLQVLTHIGELQETLGAAFQKTLYVNTYRSIVLSGKECPQPEATACPAAAILANKQLHRYGGDFEGKDVMTSIHTELDTYDLNQATYQSELELIRKRLREHYLPILKQRELAKERQLLRINATRPEVTVLPNGIQFEIEPGNQDIRDISRSTSETGITFYTRITRDIQFDALPESIRQIADQLPPASSWTFYIPYEAEQAAEEAGRRAAQDMAARREERLQQLIPDHMRNSRPAPPTEAAAPPRERKPLLRLKVWKDTPEYPATVRPDAIETVI